MTSLVGQRFEILSLAGQGGMGRVFRAWDTVDAKVIALKFLRFGLEPEAAQRFRRESDALSALDHPGIVRYVARGTTDDGVPYLAMEWLEGEELRVRLKRDGALSVPELVALASRIAGALVHAHERGIMHRDVKPANVILPGEDVGGAVLIDFGLARTAGDDVTRAGMIIGTPTYMAPEQIRDEVVTPSADVFALGCVMYECLTGARPFGTGGATAVLARVLFGEPLPLAQAADGVPATLTELVGAMLSKSSRERPSMNDVASALASLGAAQPALRAAVGARISSAEQRVVSAIVAGGAADADEDDTLRRTVGLLPESGIARLGRAAARYGAELTRLPNGSLVAVLGTRGAATDLAARAADFALALKAEMPETPIGLATGSAQTGEGVPVGEAIDRAVALPPFSGSAVRIDDVTAALLGERFVVRPEPGGALLSSRALGAEPVRTLLGKPTPCVGRDAELATLEGLVAQSESESVARAILVTSPAGGGKTRIRQELLSRWSEARGDRAVWLAQGDSVGAGAPFAMLSQIIRREAHIADGQPAAESRQKLLARAGRDAPEAEARRIATFLGEMIGVRFEEHDTQLRAARGDARLMGDQMQRAFLDLVQFENRARPLVLVLEDLQWSDHPTIAVVGEALRLFEERPLAVLAFARPEVADVFPDLWAGRRVQHLGLAPLPKKAAARLASAVLPSRTSEQVVASLVDKAGGNVFLLEELVRAEAEGRGGSAPPTVIATVQSRLSALEPEARRVLRAASVLGETFRSGAVRALLGEEAREAERWLEDLVRREVLAARPRSDTGEAEYVFRHALVRDAAYAMLTDADRTLGHKLAAEWLERGGEAPALIIAGHFERGGENARAAAAYLGASGQALESSDLAGAIDHAERGVALGAVGELRGALRNAQAHAFHWRGETERMEAAAEEAVALLDRENPRWCDAMTLLAVAKQRLGHTAELSETARSLHQALVTNGGDRAALARAGGRVASVLFFAGKQDVAAEMLDAAEVAAQGGDAAIEARIQQARAPHARQAGRPETALRHAEAAAAAFERAGDRRNACMMTGIRGFALSELGAYAEAERVMKSALETAEHLGLTTVAASCRSNLGMVFSRLGRPAEAEASVRAAIAAFETSDRRHEGGSRAYLAMILRDAGALPEAEQEARRSWTLLEAALALQPLAGAVLATVQLAAGRPAEALEAAREAMRWSEQGGNVEEGDALVRLTLARALLANERMDEAKGAIEVAHGRLLARASTIEDTSLRHSFLLVVPEHEATLALAREWLV